MSALVFIRRYTSQKVHVLLFVIPNQIVDTYDHIREQLDWVFRDFVALSHKCDNTDGIDAAQNEARAFLLEKMIVENVYSYLKFYGGEKSDTDTENYYFEREWRIVGSLRFKPQDIVSVVLPEGYQSDFMGRFPLMASKLVTPSELIQNTK